MTTLSAAGTEATVALGRGLLYAFLARGFAYPSEANRAELRDHLLPGLRELDLGDARVAEALGGCLAALPADLAELVAPHEALFTIIESRDCPTYETAYRGRDVFQQSHVMADIAGCYRAHGLAVGRRERERPDHVAVELEFMAFLGVKEAYARADASESHVEECLHSQRLFLRAHLGTWAPGFGRRVELTAGDAFYRALGRLLAVWVERDLEHLEVEPDEVVDRPLPAPPPDDGACGVGETGGGGEVVWPVQLGKGPS